MQFATDRTSSLLEIRLLKDRTQRSENIQDVRALRFFGVKATISNGKSEFGSLLEVTWNKKTCR